MKRTIWIKRGKVKQVDDLSCWRLWVSFRPSPIKSQNILQFQWSTEWNVRFYFSYIKVHKYLYFINSYQMVGIKGSLKLDDTNSNICVYLRASYICFCLCVFVWYVTPQDCWCCLIVAVNFHLAIFKPFFNMRNLSLWCGDYSW